MSVETFQNVVQLSGFVDARDSEHRAVKIARNVEGVRSVTDDLTACQIAICASGPTQRR